MTIPGGAAVAVPAARRVAAGTPAALTAVAVLAVVMDLLLEARSARWSVAPDDWVWLFGWMLWCPAGWYVGLRGGHRRFGTLLSAAGVLVVLGALAGGVAHSILLDGGPRPAGILASILQRALSDLPFFLMAAALLVFPDGRLPGRWWRPGAVALAGAALLTVAADLVRPGTLDDDLPVPNPLTVTVAPGVPAAVSSAAGVALGVALLAGLAAVGLRRRQGDDGDRAATAVFWLGACWLVALSLVALLADRLGWHMPFAVLSVQEALYVLLLPGSAAAAVVRRIRFGAEAALNRSLTYLVLATVVVGAYAGAVALLGQAVEGRSAFGVSVVVTGAIAVVLGPLKIAVQRAIERALVGQRRDPYAALTTLGSRLAATPSPEEALRAATGAIAESLRVPYVSLSVAAGQGEAVVAEHGRRTRTVLELPLVSVGEPVGTLRLAGRSANERFNPADQRLLRDFADRIAGTVALVQLTEELRRSRAAVVRAREEERRVIRRELHDGVGPVLASAVLALGRAQRRFPEGDAHHASLGDAATEVRQAIGDVRGLVHQLRPPALDELGLAAAVRQRAAALSDPVMITVEADGLGALPAAVEVAAYRIAAEAMTNVVRHAAARSCAVLVRRNGSTVEVSVTDDGTGILPGAAGGVGLLSMRERAAELGGTLHVTSVPGRTEVRACLPIG